MIKDKRDLINYLNADAVANGWDKKNNWLFELLYPNYIKKFLRLLRKCEYYKNKSSRISFILYVFYKRKLKSLSLKLSFSIPENVFGPGLSIPHYGTIVVNPNARIGSNCRLHVCTNIGASGGSSKAPQIGNNVYIAPGVKIYGDIIIANNIAIAANAAVDKSFLEEGTLIGGIPAKLIGKIDIKKLIKHL